MQLLLLGGGKRAVKAICNRVKKSERIRASKNAAVSFFLLRFACFNWKAIGRNVERNLLGECFHRFTFGALFFIFNFFTLFSNDLTERWCMQPIYRFGVIGIPRRCPAASTEARGKKRGGPLIFSFSNFFSCVCFE